MTPGARIEAAIGVLDSILGGTPAEKALTGWARRSRFAGSRDRATIRDHVFQALRCRRSFAALGGALSGRGLMIGAVRAQGGQPEDLFTGEGHAPAPLRGEECTPGQATPDDLWDLPDWLIGEFRASLGAEAEATALALRERAPVMLRVNLRKSGPEQAVDSLAAEEIGARRDPVAGAALKVVDGARRVAASRAYRDGLVELQDGSSQAAMELLPVTDGSRVLDYCAGGGGKTLALAARSEARWFAHDALPQRLKDLPARAARAGISVELLDSGALEGAAPFDLVLCDVPCSGSGTWRRTPEAKWRLTPERLEELEALQADILRRAAGLVGPGGVLAYATCSVLRRENAAQIDGFLASNPGWEEVERRAWPVSDSGDGFFLAILRCNKS